MAQPQAYNREVDFTERDGDDTNHAGINAELDAAALSINQIRDNLALIQRDDGGLQNGIVGADQLAQSAFDAIKVDINEAVNDAQQAAASATLAASTAIAARDEAQTAETSAETAAAAALLNANTATTKAAEAASSATSAATSASTATTKASEASTSATNAATSATAAAGSATTASTQATNAAASASAAATSATNAANSATTASTQAGIATTQASNAAASATAAAASFDDFEDRYLGPKSVAPTTDNDGNPLLTGALYFDTNGQGEMRVWNGSAWKAVGSAVNGTTNRATYTATAGQTTFAIVYDVGFVDVYLNGLKLQAGVEFTATNGTSIVLATGATAGDIVDIVSYGVFSVANLNASLVAATDGAGGSLFTTVAGFIARLMSNVGSALVGFIQAGIGAVQRTMQDKARDVVSVFDFMTEAQIADVKAGTLTQNVRSAIQAAFNAHKRVYFPSGTYWMGSFSLSENIVDLSNAGNGVSIFTDKSVELVCQTTASSAVPRFFYMFGNSHFNCGPIRFRDTGYDPMVNWKGAIGFFLDNNTSSNWGDVTFEAVYGKNLVSVVTASGGGASNRIRGIRIGQLFSDDCYYGFNCQNQGDGVQIDNLIAFQNYRPYFVYGCVDHKVKIFNRANRGTSGAVNISRAPGGLNTKGIDVTYVARDQTQGITHVLLNHIDLLGGVISNVKVRVDIESSVIYTPVRFVNYSGSGGSETAAASSNAVYDVELSGSCDVQASPVTVVASYGSKLNLTFNRGQNFNFDTTVLSAFRLDQASRAQAVAWTASGSNPSLGNGTLFADYDVVGGLCTCSITLTMGSTTTFGSGEWVFQLAYTSTTTAVGAVFVLDSGSAYYTGVCRIQAGGNQVQMFANGAGAGFNAGNPFAWAANDQIRATITFPIS